MVVKNVIIFVANVFSKVNVHNVYKIELIYHYAINVKLVILKILVINVYNVI